jgi:hypothetical protein
LLLWLFAKKSDEKKIFKLCCMLVLSL